ncbi:MAG TPA: fumarylacetoacetate hydrolase family protein [Candidatus Acidoferrum sp.]|nr:fumarylacetoacetate hydrolase family protein [Candidatus Acidoferrum sp.]
MKIIRYEDVSGTIRHAAEQHDGSFLRIEGGLFDGYQVTREVAKIKKLLAPVVPVMIWCIGQNYRQHADEVGLGVAEYPVVFAKGANTLQDPGEPIRIPTRARSSEIDYEGELVAVIGKSCRDVSRERALDYVAGYTCGNDVSARDWQLRMGGSQWCRGKSFDTFAPLGPCLVTQEAIGDPGTLRVKTTVNGRVMQNANTSEMIHDVAALIEFLSQNTTLLPGTVIFTGTPSGVGMAQDPPLWLKDGDEVSVIIEKIGTLTNRVCGTGS